MWPSKGTVKNGHMRKVVAWYRLNWYEMKGNKNYGHIIEVIAS
jgi:hypothetical protein